MASNQSAERFDYTINSSENIVAISKHNQRLNALYSTSPRTGKAFEIGSVGVGRSSTVLS